MDTWLSSPKDTIIAVAVVLIIILVIVLIIAIVNAYGNGSGGGGGETSSKSDSSSSDDYFGPPIENLTSNADSPTIGSSSFTGGKDCDKSPHTEETKESSTSRSESFNPLAVDSDITVTSK